MNEFRPTRFEVLPAVIKNLLIINGLVFLTQVTIAKQFNFDMDKWFALHTLQSPYFKPWQIVTHMFMHGTFDHLLFNMLALWMFGSMLENIWGMKRFIIFYFSCGFGAALAHLSFLYFEMHPYVEKFKTLAYYEQLEILNDKNFVLYSATVGASGAVFGCLAAFGFLFPNTLIYVYFLIPLKAKYFVLLYAAIEIYLGIKNSAGDNVAHIAHLGGAVVGFILVFFWNKNNRRKFY